MRTLILALCASLPLMAGSENTVFLRGATVHPVASADIPDASLLVVDGKITEIGTKLRPPKGVRIVEVKGLHIYPGMIDSATELGLSEVESVQETLDTRELGNFNPQLRAIVAVNPASDHFPVVRANGITAAITMPSGGILSGQAALLHLDGATWEEMAVNRSAATVLRVPTIQVRIGPNLPPASRVPYSEAKKRYDAQLRELGEFVQSARRYQAAKQSGAPDFQWDDKLEAMLPVLEGRLPVLAYAVRERAIRAALEFAEKEKLRLILAGARETTNVAAELKAKSIPVILGPTLALPLNEDDSYDQAYTLPAELFKAGVTFAFGSFGNQFSRNLPYQAANAVAYGLPYSEALKAVTLNPARIWGVADRMGSLEPGKWADLIVTDGDPLETRTQIRQVFIQGRQIDLANRHQRLYEQYRNTSR